MSPQLKGVHINVVSHFILQNTGIFRSDYPTGEKSDMYCKETITLWGNNIRSPLYAFKTSGFGAEPQLYVNSVALKSVF